MSYAFDGEHEITFGKHRGKRLADIPASYLLWLAESEHTLQTVGIFGYVHKHRQRLERERDEGKEKRETISD